MRSLDLILISMAVSFGLSVIYMILVQFLPRIMNFVAVIAGLILMIALMICIALYDTDYTKSKWAVFVVLLILVVVTVGTVFFNWNGWSVHGLFLDEATKMVCDRLEALLYIPLFLIMATGFVFLLLFEFRSFWMHGTLNFDPEASLFWTLNGVGPVILTVLWVIQAIWGLSFLK